MKKLYSMIMMLAMMVAALGLTACGGDDEEDDAGGTSSSSLVGTWDVVQSVWYKEGQEPMYEDGDGAYWVFTANKVIVYTPVEIVGRSIYYTYRENKLYIDDVTITVIELTSNKLVIRFSGTVDYVIKEFKKR